MAEAGAGEAGKIDSAPRIQMMRDLLSSMGVEESDPKVRAAARTGPLGGAGGANGRPTAISAAPGPVPGRPAGRAARTRMPAFSTDLI